MTNSDVASQVTPGLMVEVVGTPAPQGSKSFKGLRGGKPILVESCTAVGPWREAVVTAARSAMGVASWATLDGPVAVTVDFYLARPASAPKRRLWPDRRPDLDKLVRSTLDALTTAAVYTDDGRVVCLVASKHYGLNGPGARITVRQHRSS